MNAYVIMISCEQAFERAGDENLKLLCWWLPQEMIDSLNTLQQARGKPEVTHLLRLPIFKTTSEPRLQCAGSIGEVEIPVVVPDLAFPVIPPALNETRHQAYAKMLAPRRWFLNKEVLAVMTSVPGWSGGILTELFGIPVYETSGPSHLIAGADDGTTASIEVKW